MFFLEEMYGEQHSKHQILQKPFRNVWPRASANKVPFQNSHCGANTNHHRGMSLRNVEEKVLTLARSILGMRFSSDQTFSEAGMDSLTTLEFSHAIATTFDITISPITIFDYPSSSTLANYIFGKKLLNSRQEIPNLRLPLGEGLG
jgi:acyl carrier protein